MATKTKLIGNCCLHGEFYRDALDSLCPSCEDKNPDHVHLIVDRDTVMYITDDQCKELRAEELIYLDSEDPYFTYISPGKGWKDIYPALGFEYEEDKEL